MATPEELVSAENLVNGLDAKLPKSVATGGGPLGGAWSSYYQYGDSASPTSPRGYGIISIKHALIYNGFDKGIVPELPTIGDATRNRIVEFQRRKGIEADGVVGPRTAKELFKKRIYDEEAAQGIPDHLIFREIGLESGFDPGAVGSVDPRDRGLAQINSGAHPDVSDAEAFDSAFSIPWTCEFLISNRTRVGGDWDGALAAHNIGWYYAKKWVDAGKPADGLVTTGGKDYAKIATTYVNLVKARPSS